jgi:hypothetical protein
MTHLLDTMHRHRWLLLAAGDRDKVSPLPAIGSNSGPTRVNSGSNSGPARVLNSQVTHRCHHTLFLLFPLIWDKQRIRQNNTRTMAYPENVGIKALEIYVPAQVKPFSSHPNPSQRMSVRVSDEKSAWTNSSSRNTKAFQPASTPLDWAFST